MLNLQIIESIWYGYLDFMLQTERPKDFIRTQDLYLKKLDKIAITDLNGHYELQYASAHIESIG